MTISELADATGVSAHTLRYYEKMGLVPLVERDHWKGRLDHRKPTPFFNRDVSVLNNQYATRIYRIDPVLERHALVGPGQQVVVGDP